MVSTSIQLGIHWSRRWAHSVGRAWDPALPVAWKTSEKLSGPNDLATQSSKGGMKDLNRRTLDTNYSIALAKKKSMRFVQLLSSDITAYLPLSLSLILAHSHAMTLAYPHIDVGQFSIMVMPQCPTLTNKSIPTIFLANPKWDRTDLRKLQWPAS